MIRRFSTGLLSVVALVPVVKTVCHAQSLPPLTRHVRDVTLNGQAHPAGRLPGRQILRLVLVLPLRNQAALDDLLQEVYNPSSLSYHQFLTVVGTARNRMNVDVTGSVAGIEGALHVTMGVYQHPTENRTFYAPDREPTTDLPVALWHISGLDNYSIPQPALVRRPPGAQPAATTGSCPSSSFAAVTARGILPRKSAHR